ncbi:MAG: 16S rRNA processing protein RimM [Alphaproteobacteria bacterium]|jgi:16S rRNA processing protein RimM|nr:16S rRNA processing protein RimM [Alphaproteobacteria bacterium]
MPTRPIPPPDDRRLVCLGQISGAHGVRGLVKVRSFTEEPEGLVAYGPLTDAGGRRIFALSLLSPHKGQFLARIDGLTDREAAAALAGTRLYVPRERLPPPDEADAFYQADLIGLEAVDAAGTSLGQVVAVHDFGAGDVLEVALAAGGPAGGRGSLLLPFTRTVVPEVDLGAGRLVVEPPVEAVEEGPDEPAEPASDREAGEIGREARSDGPRAGR